MAFGRVTPFDDPLQRFAAGKLGMALFLASLAMLFAASVIGFVVVRLTADEWPDLPGLPPILWASTAVLVVSSFTMQRGLSAIRRDRSPILRMAMLATIALGVVFLVLQVIAWRAWLDLLGERMVSDADQRFALSGFYVLTGVHALHVIGGLVPMVLVTRGALRGRYSAAHHAAVQYCAMYWHFLDVVWLVLFTALLVGL